MSRIKQLSADYVSAMSGLTLEEQAVLLALILQFDDEGRGIANPYLIQANSAQLITMSVGDVAICMEALLEKWEPYGEYSVNGTTYYTLADFRRFATTNHPTPSKLPPPPPELLPQTSAPPSRGRPRGSGRKAESKAKTPSKNWSDPAFPEPLYQRWKDIYNAQLGDSLGQEEFISRNSRRNIDLSIAADIDEAMFQKACAIAAKSDWFCGRSGQRKLPSNFEITCAPSTIKSLLEGRYGGL